MNTWLQALAPTPDALARPRISAKDKPCGECGTAPRYYKSFCQDCYRAYNHDNYLRIVLRRGEPTPRTPAKDKPCARCKTAPRELKSYCRGCHNLYAKATTKKRYYASKGVQHA